MIKIDSVYGFFPESFGTGVQFNLGNETGLVHTYVDSPLVNGMRYYYAVTAYDKGDLENNIGPTETTIFVNVDQAGNIQLGENVVAVTPSAPALGYDGPDFDKEPHMMGSGVSHGWVGVDFLDPDSLVDGDEYEIQFLDQSMDFRDNDFDTLVDMDDPSELIPNQTTGFVLRNLTRSVLFDTVWFKNYRSLNGETILLSNLFDDRDGDPRTASTIVNSLKITARVPEAGRVHMPERNIYNGTQWSRNIDPDTTYKLLFGRFNLGGFVQGTAYPRQYEIVFFDELVTTTKQIGIPLASTGTLYPLPSAEVNYKVYDKQSGEEVTFGVVDATVDKDLVNPGFFSAKDRLIFVEKLPNDSTLITFSLLNNSVEDTTFINHYGRTLGAGDTLSLYPDFPFTSETKFRFKVKGQKIDQEEAKNSLNRIKVVPNPYVVTAVWEPQNPYTSGRGPRKVEFIHLPQECTIRIYSLDGSLIKTIEHNSSMTDGSEEWDLMTKDNMDLAYGVYVYHVDAPGIGEHVGRMLVIK
ncbi:MAG: hypothetical protein U5R06_03265 [candidate division KSB1 bacterium]|nr:hypothetical protein [candidate division KSB1 bacterium]